MSNDALNALAAQYEAALQEYLTDAGEAALQRAYELGHDALGQGLRMLDVVAAHHEALGSLLLRARTPEERTRTVHAGATFLMESLSPFEMTHRAFLEANATLRSLNQTLTQRVQDVEFAHAQIEAAAQRKDEFLAMLAHELRNPLAPILSAVHVMSLRVAHDPALHRAGNVVHRQVRHMARLLDDLLDVSRIIHGKIQLRKEQVDVATVVKNALQTSRPFVEAGQHEVSIDLPEEPLWLEGDPTRLEQVVTNLLNNAAKFTPAGGCIGVTVQREGEEAVVRVWDAGAGISPELLPRIFDLFTQADRSLDRSQGGLGIGLTLVRRLVELHGGSVEAASAGPGRGSEFTIRLPAQAEARAEEPAPVRWGAPLPAACRRRVLLVEDNLDAAETLAELLECWGHEVRVALDGAAALAAARVDPPEVVLLDIGLPGMDGYEVARRLQEQPDLERPLLVALTGYGGEEDRRRAREAGFDQHLTKPVDLTELERLLAAASPGT